MRYRDLLLVIITFFSCNLWGQVNLHTHLNSWLKQYENVYTENSPEYADAVQICAISCMKNGDLKQANYLIENSDRIFKSFGKGIFEGRDTIQEIFHLDLMSQLEYECDRDYISIRYARKSHKLKQAYFGSESSVTLMSALNLSRLLAERYRYRESNNIHNNAYATYVNILKNEFCSISESERAVYWKTAYNYVAHTIQIANNHPKSSNKRGNKSLAAAAYNALLLSKGILLNTSIGFEDYVKQSGNSNAINKLKAKKSLQNQSYPQAVLDSIDYEILNDLSLSGNSYKIPHLDITWKDVQHSLQHGDVAIEFYRTDDHDYGAIILKHGWKSPKVIKLGNDILISKHHYVKLDDILKENLLQTIDYNNLGKLWSLSKAVWTDELIQYLPTKGKGKIYFSADANLQIAGIESFLLSPHLTSKGDVVTMNDCFDLYRLSSTRELCYKHSNEKKSSAVLYGGLEYNLTDEELVAEHKDFQNATKSIELENLIAENRSLAIRETDNIDILPGTKVEIDAIDTILKQNLYIQPTLHTGVHGTEETFKYISGKSPEIIHIATHGFYIPEEPETLDSLISTDILNLSKENYNNDNSMIRSGLLMSGAMSAYFQNPIPNGIEDGILTSKEISLLDLRNTQIAVLSACETALGDVTKDGISGLQRGFKQSGTHSLLMSLWKVNDEATCKLMTEFYSNWINKKKTKHQALEDAKYTIRNTKGWESPKFWAAFVLLDGIE